MARRSTATAQATATVVTRTTLLNEEDVERVGRDLRTLLSCARRDANTASYADGSPKSNDKRKFEADHLRRVTEVCAAFRFCTGFDPFAAVEESTDSHKSFMARMGF